MTRTLAFRAPLSVTSLGVTHFIPSNTSPPSNSSSKRFATHRRYQISCSAGWKDIVFGQNSDDQSNKLSHTAYSEGFPQTYGTLHLLGISSCDNMTYATFQTNERNPATRATYSISSEAFPLPHTRPAERFLVHDAFAALYGTPCPAGTALSPASTAFSRDLLPAELTRYLDANVQTVADAGRNVLKEYRGGPLNRAGAMCSLLRELRARVVAASVEEVSSVSTSDTNVSLSGVLFVEKELTRLYGETFYTGKVERILCTPVEAVAIANVAMVPCYIQRDLFEGGSHLVGEMVKVFASRGEKRVHLKYSWGENELGVVVLPPDTDGRKLPEAWQLKAEDVLAMSDDELRRNVAANGLPTVRGEDRNSLLRKLVDLMDEVERRELAIQLAAEQELYGLAGEMQASRSKRGELLQELKEAEEKEMWSEVIRLGQKIRLLESQTADITAEPGSYSPYLDQDEWYKPNR